MRRLICGMLEAVGVENLLLTNCVADARLSLRIHAPDIILLDRQLRDGDGLSLLRRVRASVDRVRATIPIIMLTAHGDEATVLAARDSGANAFLVKPVSAERLIRRIAWIVDPQSIDLDPVFE